MSADCFRQAAEILRVHAENATAPGEMHPWGDKSLPETTVDQWASEMDGYLGGTWGALAGLMSPPVVKALADWLNEEAARSEERDVYFFPIPAIEIVDKVLACK